MNIIVAPDAFKDCLSAEGVGQAMCLGINDYSQNASSYVLQVSDGGEGFLEAVRSYVNELTEVSVKTLDPLGREIKASYLYDSTEQTAYIELARASGIELLSSEERNPLITSTYGTGIQIRDAINQGAKTIYVGLGGSSTNDAGTGMAQAIGYRFLDSEGKEVIPCGGNLAKIVTIEKPGSMPTTEFYAINDVLNPLYGPTGAAYTYAPQKGASPEDVLALDDGLKNLDAVVQEKLGYSKAMVPGTGAAGGSGYGLHVFLNATFITGTRFILGLSDFYKLLKDHKIELILTGEGKIDDQTAYGKLVHGLITEGQKNEIPVAAICGKLDLSGTETESLGLATVRELYDQEKPVEYSYSHASELIRKKTTEILNTVFGTPTQ